MDKEYIDTETANGRTTTVQVRRPQGHHDGPKQFVVASGTHSSCPHHAFLVAPSLEAAFQWVRSCVRKTDSSYQTLTWNEPMSGHAKELVITERLFLED